MSLSLDDTIAAVASPPGPAKRAVIRVSGPACRSSIERVFAADDGDAWVSPGCPTRFSGRIGLPGLPRGLPCDAFVWPTSSYTGQPALELHFVGSPPIVDEVLAAVIAAGARPANRGEFTMRAFLAGQLDLTQAEAVLGVINAEDHTELVTALEQLDGGLVGPLRELHEQLLVDLADLEAGLDFADEDLDFVSRTEFSDRLTKSINEIDRLVAQQEGRSRSRVTETVVLTGPPNAGKSTLFNALVGDSAAIVSDTAGTTRDVIECDIVIAKRVVRLVDTAGIEDGRDALVTAAEAKRRLAADDAALIVYCTPAGAPVDEAEVARLAARRPLMQVETKADLGATANGCVSVCAIAGRGLDSLRVEIAQRLESDLAERSQLLASTAARCRGVLVASRERLLAALELLRDEAGDELVAGELRAGLDKLAAVLGRVYTDDILDRVFSRFCIGK